MNIPVSIHIIATLKSAPKISVNYIYSFKMTFYTEEGLESLKLTSAIVSERQFPGRSALTYPYGENAY